MDDDSRLNTFETRIGSSFNARPAAARRTNGSPGVADAGAFPVVRTVWVSRTEAKVPSGV